MEWDIFFCVAQLYNVSPLAFLVARLLWKRHSDWLHGIFSIPLKKAETLRGRRNLQAHFGKKTRLLSYTSWVLHRSWWRKPLFSSGLSFYPIPHPLTRTSHSFPALVLHFRMVWSSGLGNHKMFFLQEGCQPLKTGKETIRLESFWVEEFSPQNGGFHLILCFGFVFLFVSLLPRINKRKLVTWVRWEPAKLKFWFLHPH